MRSRSYLLFVCLAALALLLASGCGGGSNTSSTSTSGSSSTTGSIQLAVSDDPVEDWSVIGVKLLSVALVPSSGSAVTVVTMPTPAPTINLLQLDQLGEIIGNLSGVPAGTYTAVQLTLSANAGDVSLIASGDPESGFDVAEGATVTSSQVQIVGAAGSSGSQTVQLSVPLSTPLTVSGGSTNVVDVEFDLAHPAFLVEHSPAGASAPTWAVDFRAPVRHHPLATCP